MRIAQVSPLYESVPPKLYGGTERVVAFLCDELVAEGHDVTLYASGDSRTAATLVACCPRSLRLDDSVRDPLAPHFLMLERVFRDRQSFDFIHFHCDYLHFPWSRRTRVPRVTTLHGRLDLPELPALYDEFGDEPVVSISNSQRRPLPQAQWEATVYHGLPRDLFTAEERNDGYLAFLGRISPEKGPHRAIEIARRSGMPLKIAAKVDRADQAYFDEVIAPMLGASGVEFIGEIGEQEKQAFLGRATALLFPIEWPEPFGIVLIEAMACGTPTIAFRHGSVPELIDDGVSGYVVDTVDEAVAAVGRVAALSRRGCRERFESRFTAERMARDYLSIYQRLADAR